MVLGTIIAIIMLAVYGIAMTILNYKQNKFIEEMVDDYTDLGMDLVNSLLKRDELRKEIEAQKDTIADLSKQINEATVKSAKPEANETAAEPITSKKTTTTKKTTTRKRTTKKKEVKE